METPDILEIGKYKPKPTPAPNQSLGANETEITANNIILNKDNSGFQPLGANGTEIATNNIILDKDNSGLQSSEAAAKDSSTNNDQKKLIVRKIGDHYRCPVCKYDFFRLNNLRRHVKKQHSDMFTTVFPPSAFRCQYCEKGYKSKISLQAHIRRFHKAMSSIPMKKHNCPLCPESLERRKFYEHFEKCHYLSLKPIKLSFNSVLEFFEWKKDIERITKSYFAKQSIRVSKNITRHAYICHRSGTFVSAGKNKRKLKGQGSKKINAFCPATIYADVKKGGKCDIRFQSQHIGHNHELQHLSLTIEERRYIAEKLALNLPLKDVLNDIRNSASILGFERLSILTRKDLHNINARFKKDRESFYSLNHKHDEKTLSILRDIHNKHYESEKIKADITKIEKGWLLTLTESSEIFLIKENIKSCDCPLICTFCRSCIKLYTCNCADSSIGGNMCKHIHFLCREKNKITDVSVENEATSMNSDTSQCGDTYVPGDDVSSDLSDSDDRDNNRRYTVKRNMLKRKYTQLIELIKTEEEYKIVKNAFRELTDKLKSIKNNTNRTSNVITPTANQNLGSSKIVSIPFVGIPPGNVKTKQNLDPSKTVSNQILYVLPVNQNVKSKQNLDSSKTSVNVSPKTKIPPKRGKTKQNSGIPPGNVKTKQNLDSSKTVTNQILYVLPVNQNVKSNQNLDSSKTSVNVLPKAVLINPNVKMKQNLDSSKTVSNPTANLPLGNVFINESGKTNNNLVTSKTVSTPIMNLKPGTRLLVLNPNVKPKQNLESSKTSVNVSPKTDIPPKRNAKRKQKSPKQSNSSKSVSKPTGNTSRKTVLINPNVKTKPNLDSSKTVFNPVVNLSLGDGFTDESVKTKQNLDTSKTVSTPLTTFLPGTLFIDENAKRKESSESSKTISNPSVNPPSGTMLIGESVKSKLNLENTKGVSNPSVNLPGATLLITNESVKPNQNLQSPRKVNILTFPPGTTFHHKQNM